MRIRLDKTDDGKLDVSVKRTRREETPVKPIRGVPVEQLGDAVSELVKKTRTPNLTALLR